MVFKDFVARVPRIGLSGIQHVSKSKKGAKILRFSPDDSRKQTA